MKKKFIDVTLGLLFFGSFACFSVWIIQNIRGNAYNGVGQFPRPDGDQYDPSLARLNSVDKLVQYCDSVYAVNAETTNYPNVVSETLSKRFYHGYSYYKGGTNTFGVMIEPLIGNGATAIVIADDIAKFPHAACSQQSILGMEIFKRKGYSFRKVSMYDTVTQSGHFAYEVQYDNKWHFFDTDQEPDYNVLKLYDRPSATFLAKNPEIILAAYHSRKDPQLFKRLLTSYQLGVINQFPAPNALLYQVITKYITYFAWVFFLLIIAVRYQLSRQKKVGKTYAILPSRKEQHVTVFS